MDHPLAVSIAGRTPVDFTGRVYKQLAPKFWFFKKYKLDGDTVFYTAQYRAEVLDMLDPKEVLRDLGEDAILLCYEKPGEFCHRHLVAKWLEDELGIEVKEL
jgi:hypothetical protein